MADKTNSILVRVTHDKKGPVINAEVRLSSVPAAPESRKQRAAETVPRETKHTDAKGEYTFRNVPPGTYQVHCSAFGLTESTGSTITILDDGQTAIEEIDLKLGFAISPPHSYTQHGDAMVPALRTVTGQQFVVRLERIDNRKIAGVRWNSPGHAVRDDEAEYVLSRPGLFTITATAVGHRYDYLDDSGKHPDPASATVSTDVYVRSAEPQTIAGHIGVTLQRTASDPTLDQALWVAIRNRTHAISFNRYREFLNGVLRWEEGAQLPEISRRMKDDALQLYGVGAYQLLKFATEAFLLAECGVRISDRDREDRFDTGQEVERLGEPFTREDMRRKLHEYLGNPPQLPYITRVVEAAFPDIERDGHARLLTGRISEPCMIELIHSYWLEEGMLMQTMNAISFRFQNARGTGDRDPLANMEIDSLRPLNSLLWGYIQDELNRLSVRRRAAEYAHEYGLALFGKATNGMRPADNRSKFLEGFHNLLLQSSKFFKEDFQTTVIADGFPLLNSLKEVHLTLAQGAHNQFRNLTWTARVESLLSQFLLARPEMREFLQSRVMVPYKEPWMAQVDTMKTMQGWTDVTVTHFRDLAVYGEQLLLSIRYGDWINVNDEDSAKNWARYWRPEIQGYMHAYRAATGVELTNTESVDTTIPAVHLQRRLATQQQQRAR
jgi:hypothetical protein